MKGDLHCHTKVSDGSMGIEEVVSFAARRGLDFVAITDHDTMAGVTRACVVGKRQEIRVIPGVEITGWDYGRDRLVHMLCYLPKKPDRLETLFKRALDVRREAIEYMLPIVMEHYPVTREQVEKYASGSNVMHKVHIMHALMDMGYTSSIFGELWGKLFSEGGLCCCEPKFTDIYEVLETIQSAGGVAVLAHPGRYQSFELLEELAQKELIDGVEVWHPGNEWGEEEKLLYTAKCYGLITTGGTDFHGAYECRATPIGTCTTPAASIQKIIACAEKKAKSL